MECSVLSGEACGEVLEEVVKIAVAEVQLSEDVSDLLALGAAPEAEDLLDHNIGGDDVSVAGSGAGDFVGLNGEVFFSEEGGEVHGLRC